MKKFSIIFWLLIFAAICAGQDGQKKEKTVPDLTGTWVLDKEGSYPESGFGAKLFVDITMVIVHNEPEVKVTETLKMPGGAEMVSKTIYFTDGRRVALFGRNDENNFRTVEWDGRKLIRRDTFVLKKGDGFDWLLEKNGTDKAKMNNKLVWEISKDGKVLKQKVSGGTIPGATVSPSGLVMVFRRQL